MCGVRASACRYPRRIAVTPLSRQPNPMPVPQKWLRLHSIISFPGRCGLRESAAAR
ncbi:hypothetical protein PSAB6_590042 [Paraburkholderia sabiae]|nr:hypothetical protein PSAB6_590042 [Paraburkholderia sabiae]